jgi:hypothetical protein
MLQVLEVAQEAFLLAGFRRAGRRWLQEGGEARDPRVEVVAVKRWGEPERLIWLLQRCTVCLRVLLLRDQVC